MKRRKRYEETLHRVLGEYSRMPDKQVDAGVDRALSDLRTKMHLQRTDRPAPTKEALRFQRRWWQLAVIPVAAALVLMVLMRTTSVRNSKPEIAVRAVVE